MNIFDKKVKRAKKKNKFYNYLIDNGYNAEDSVEMTLEYFKKRTGGVLRAANVIADWDDRDHDYTGELIFCIMSWEYKQMDYDLVSVKVKK